MPAWLPLVPALLAVLAIYLIRPAAQTLSVASTLLWRRLLAARRRRHDRLRWLLSLLLAMAVAGCLALAAGQAAWLQPGGGDRIALAFDPSPSMGAALPDASGAGNGRAARFDLAVAEARRIVTEANAGSRFTIGADPTPLHRNEALLALSRLALPEFGGRAADLEPAIPAADVVYLLTDGVGDWKPITDPATETRIVSVLAPARNAGIVLFTTRPTPSRDAPPEALLEVLATDAADASRPVPRPTSETAAGHAVPVELTVADSERMRIRRQLELPPGDRFAALIDLSGFATGPVTARVTTPGDALPLDDRATLRQARIAFSVDQTGGGEQETWRRHGARRLLVHARSRASFDDSAVARAFEANASIEVAAVIESGASENDDAAAAPDSAERSGPARGDTTSADPAATGQASAHPVPTDLDSAGPESAEIAVFHRAAPARLPALPRLFLDPPDAAAAGGLSAAKAGTRSQRRIDRVDSGVSGASGHPILAGVSLLGLPATFPVRELDPRCRPLASAGGLTAVAVCDPADPAAAPAATPASGTGDAALPPLAARSVVIAFDLERSPLARRPDLAALLQNAVEWLADDHGAESSVGGASITGNSGTGNSGTGNSGTGNSGTGNSGTGNSGTGHSGAGHSIAGNSGTGNWRGGLQDERASRINDSALDPAPPGRLAELAQGKRRPWSWRAFAVAGLLLAAFEAVTFFRGLTT